MRLTSVLSCPSQPLAYARTLVTPRAEQPIPTPSFAWPFTSEPPTSSYLQAANGDQTTFLGAGQC